MDLASKVLQQIELNKVRPKSKAVVIAQRILVVAGFLFVLLLGSYSFSLLFFAMRSELGPFQRGIGYMHVAVDRLPMLLALTVLLTLAIGYFLFRKTKRGYRARSLWLMVALVVAILAGGFVFDRSNAVFYGHRWMMKHVGAYRHSMQSYREQVWNNPDKGRLIGKIISTDWDRFELKTPDGKVWTVDDVDARWMNMQMRYSGDSIKIIGTKRQDSSFDADYILPWRGSSPRHRGKGSAP